MSDKFELMLITNNPDISAYAEMCGVTRIFIDLEINGKHERQGHLDTVISDHSIEDIKIVKSVLKSSKLLVRINPVYNCTSDEIDKVIDAGADIIMLPMFKTLDEVNFVNDYIAGRVDFIPLVETKEAISIVSQISELNGITEVYIGLNDLHRSLDMKFMFEPLLDGTVDEMVVNIKRNGKKFGFGGVAKMGMGVLPSELVIAEHIRLGSSSVIISRSFHMKSETIEDFKAQNFEHEIKKLKQQISIAKDRNISQIYNDKINLHVAIGKIIGVYSETAN